MKPGDLFTCDIQSIDLIVLWNNKHKLGEISARSVMLFLWNRQDEPNSHMVLTTIGLGFVYMPRRWCKVLKSAGLR